MFSAVLFVMSSSSLNGKRFAKVKLLFEGENDEKSKFSQFKLNVIGGVGGSVTRYVKINLIHG